MISQNGDQTKTYSCKFWLSNVCFPWIKIEGENISGGISDGDGIYAWDGSLLSNTPVREVLNVSPRNDKNIFIVENYPRKVRRLPSNMAEVQSRATKTSCLATKTWIQ